MSTPSKELWCEVRGLPGRAELNLGRPLPQKQESLLKEDFAPQESCAWEICLGKKLSRIGRQTPALRVLRLYTAATEF